MRKKLSKKLKQYKMFVPESDWYDEVLLDRQEIHEIVQPHAEKLGYSDAYVHNDRKYICFYDKTVKLTDSEKAFKTLDGQEISWQDFLKLTEKDVEVKPKSEGYMDIEYIIEQRLGKDFVLDEAEMSALYQHVKDLQNIFPATTERNEIALEILKIIIPMNFAGHKNISDDVEYSFRYADEFLKQAGGK